MLNKVSTGLVAGIALAASAASAQTFQRNAVFTNGGSPDRGECTVEVVVDGAAQVEIRQGSGLLRNLNGQAPQWRRFECTSAMPANPSDFRFEGVDGRGRQSLVADPRNGGAAIVRIEDSDSGTEGYTFRLVWGNFSGGGGPITDNSRRGPQVAVQVDPQFHTDRDNSFRGTGGRGMFFQRIREDLDHATSQTYGWNGDRARLDRTRVELDELQQKLARGLYDERQLDSVIASMRVVVRANRMDQRERAVLNDDLSRLQDFRVRHDDYGARAAQNGGYYRNDRDDAPYHQERDRQFSGNDWRGRFFERIRGDLDHATLYTSPFGGDRARLNRTQTQLDELQTKLSRGFYDERELDDVINAMQVVLGDNRMRQEDRSILSDDLGKMRDFRLRHDQYGAR